MKTRSLAALLASMAILALCATLGAQATTSLRGTVTDPSGAAVPNARLVLTNPATNVARQATSASDGSYSFVAVLPGSYDLTVSANGFKTFERKGFALEVNLPATENVRLSVGAVSSTVEVSGQAPLLNTTDASVGQAMGTNAVENLPLRAENTALLLSLQPGVTFTGSTTDMRSGSVNGERSDQNNITLDGVSNNNEFANYAFDGVLPTTPFSVQEFRVTTSNYAPDQGHTAGAQIAMVTKGGTDHLHGSLYEFNRTQFGEANDYFLKTSELLNNEANKPPHLVRNVYGGTLGGPLVKDRLFFFVNYEGHRQSAASSAVRTIPTATLRDGIIQYACADATQCPGGSVAGVSGQSYTIAPGYYGVSPTQLKKMDPLGAGPSAVALNYFQSYPLPNDFSVGNTVNYAGYRFGAPSRSSDNWYIGRFDYNLTPDGSQALFFRGTAVDDNASGVPFLPGMAPENKSVDLSKGFVLGYTAVYNANWVNSFRVGLTRQSTGSIGDGDLPWVEMRGLSQDINRTGGVVAPVYNFVDTLSWHKGAHNFQFGTNILAIRRNSQSDSNSFSDVLTNSDWVDTSGFAGKTASPLNPASAGLPDISGGFANAYDFPLAAMMGIGSEVDARYNYAVVSATQAAPLSQGAAVARHWATDTYNFFAQDTWQVFPTLSFNYGLNYQLMTPVAETRGQEVEPNINMGDWFSQRAANMAKGIPSNQDPIIRFAPAGPVFKQPGLYSAQTKNFAPRIGLAWSPRPTSGWLHTLFGNGQSAVRAGFGMYYDNFGPALALTYDAVGSFGLSSVLQNPAGELSLSDAPRITDMHAIPTTNNSGQTIMPAAPSSSFPVTYSGVEAIARGIDQSLKTPYSYAADLSIERNLPGGMTLDLSYVGHFAHRLLAYDDIATPTNLVDPKSGIDYFSAATRLSQLGRQNTPDSAITAALIGPTAQYWQDMLTPSASGSYRLCSGGTTPDMLTAVYDEFGPNCNLYNETSALWAVDRHGRPAWPTLGKNSFYNKQYSSLYVWRSIGYSNYNAFELGLHKQSSNGLLFGFNYTFSKSLDIESMDERGARHNSAVIINPWSPYQLYGPADSDLRHQVNAYWVAPLPFGRGQFFAGNAGRALNAVIGGWQLSGTTRWTSGFPASVLMAFTWPTNWEEMGLGNMTAAPATGVTLVNGKPNVFKDPTAAAKDFDFAYPGQSGMRNTFRGDGFFDWDMSLAKQFTVPGTENQHLRARWSVFNVPNSHSFDINSAQLEWDDSSTFGNYTGTLTEPRVMEFSLLYSF